MPSKNSGHTTFATRECGPVDSLRFRPLPGRSRTLQPLAPWHAVQRSRERHFDLPVQLDHAAIIAIVEQGIEKPIALIGIS